MSFMPNIGTQVKLQDGRTAWVSQITPDGSDDRVIFEDLHEETIDVYAIESIQEEVPFGFVYPDQQRLLNYSKKAAAELRSRISELEAEIESRRH